MAEKPSIKEHIAERKSKEKLSEFLEDVGWYFAVVVTIGVIGEVIGLIDHSLTLDISFAGVTAIGVAGEVVVSRVSSSINKRIRSIQEKIDLEQEIQNQAYEDRIAESHKVAEKANEKAEKERTERLKREKKDAPRALSPSQLQVL